MAIVLKDSIVLIVELLIIIRRHNRADNLFCLYLNIFYHIFITIY